MQSKGKLFTYHCHFCDSTNIKKAPMYNSTSVVCNNCNCWYPWSMVVRKRILPSGNVKEIRPQLSFQLNILRQKSELFNNLVESGEQRENISQ